MRKITFFILCVFLPLLGQAQTSKQALLKLFMPKRSFLSGVTTTGDATRDAIALAALRADSEAQIQANKQIVQIAQRALSEGRPTDPTSLLAYEILQKKSLLLFNATSANVKTKRLDVMVVSSIGEMKRELVEVSKMAPSLTFEQFIVMAESAKSRLQEIDLLQMALDTYSKEHPDGVHDFFFAGQDALAWLKYYYSALIGKESEIPADKGQKSYEK